MPEDEEATGREREVLRTRRESRERLGDRAFALSLEQALGVPRARHGRRASGTAHGALAPDTIDRGRRTVAGRIVLKRDMGKLAFLVLRDRSGDIQLVVNQDTEPESRALLREVDLGDIVGCDRPASGPRARASCRSSSSGSRCSRRRCARCPRSGTA